jgi:hypothetical protein
MPPLNIASPDCVEAFFAGRAARCAHLHHAGTLAELRQVLGLPVFGTPVPLLKSHSNAHGFDPAFSHVLIEASALDSDLPDS